MKKVIDMKNSRRSQDRTSESAMKEKRKAMEGGIGEREKF